MAEHVNKVSIKHGFDAKHIDIQKDPFHPSAYIITLPLDSEPSYEWHTLFDQELWSSLDFWDRKVLVVGKAIKLVTSTDQLQDKLHWLERLIVATNKRVEDHNKRAKAEKKAQETRLLEEEAIRRDLSSWQINRLG